jgi:general secretion pathway protein H
MNPTMNPTANRAADRSAASRDLGFTLMELLVVLGILALGVALVAPSLNRARLGPTAKRAAYELAASLRSARAAARATNAEHSLTVDLWQRRYWAEGVTAPRQLPSGLAIDLAVPESERLGTGAARVRFFPDGSASGAGIVLNDGRSSASVSVDWLTGDVRIRPGS